MSFKKEWYRVDDMVQTELGEIPVWQFLGHKNIRALRDWITLGVRQGWLKRGDDRRVAHPHVKKLTPRGRPWLLHLERCQSVGIASQNKSNR